MVRSKLLDRGAQWMDIYPEVVVINKRGAKVRQPADKPVRVRVTTAVDRSQTADVQGQLDMDIMRVIARNAPVGPWARVVMNGIEYDVTAPPRHSPGVSKASRHTEFTIRDRSSLGAKKTG
ncbi:hypothetical protein AUR04nite_00510 [Glutamicibacter uratoxydans]|uniref:Phage protein n=1 Tax=Glutamicibacter uratoxydans TaxID=43667 RepID=A0A4Y4DH19_GLUUR|nr:hypothetical protein AUR04nite_00510 [Glutamicibacter uratoxydans]